MGLSSRETMSIAQKLYERGFITYMRTDSIHLSDQAIQAARKCIQSLYGQKYLPHRPRSYKAKKVKGAQEAHEAIRPTGDAFKKPNESGLTGASFKLYDLIWKRTIASQMNNSEHKQVSVQFKVGNAVFLHFWNDDRVSWLFKGLCGGKGRPRGRTGRQRSSPS